MSSDDVYVHGHHESVLTSHRWRTVENSAPHLVDRLEPGQTLLDVGCGPGTITVDLARRLAPGTVVGLDSVPEIVAAADGLRVGAHLHNCRFEVGDVYALDHPDGAFDVVHAHQVLQHLTDPVAALAEMRRVTRPGGLVAARDADYAAMTWWPASPMLDRWQELYHQITVTNRCEADAGRRLLGWAQAAGFEDIEATSSSWTFADPASRQWWGQLWADRVLSSSYAEQALEHELSTQEELDAIAAAWRAWAEDPAGWFAVLHGEVLARV